MKHTDHDLQLLVQFSDDLECGDGLSSHYMPRLVALGWASQSPLKMEPGEDWEVVSTDEDGTEWTWTGSVTAAGDEVRLTPAYLAAEEAWHNAS